MASTTEKEPGPGKGEQERLGEEPPGVQGDAPSAESQGEGTHSRIDQVGSIVAKGLDLIEAAVVLGVNLATRFGSIVQEGVAERTNHPGGTSPEPAPESYAGPMPGGAQPGHEAHGPAAAAESHLPVQYVVNRLPLFPGSPVRVSFTINNDSASLARKIRLRVEGFAGETRGGALNGQSFAVKPAVRVIAPMDFDKFTLTGDIPADALFDVYQGWIVVSEEQEFRIPVRLLVAEPPA